jgi:hypothetical protein
MIWNLVATAFAGLGAAGVALILRMLSRKKLPKWIIPVFAGAGMLAYQIYIEYTALGLIKSRLPEGTVVLETETDSMIWRPWTYLVPLETAFTALDQANADSRILDTGEEVVRFVLYRFERHHVTQARPQGYLINCANREVVKLDENGRPLATPAEPLARSEQVFTLLCRS